MSCISTPISWLRLERFALDANDASIAEHVAACPACAKCLDEIRVDVVALPVLAVPEKKRRWWLFAMPALAAAIALLLVWPRRPEQTDRVVVKGVGEVILGLVRERDGVIRNDATTFLPADRWKVVVTCPPAAAAWVLVDVEGDHPLAPARVACGNRVVIPGAFSLNGATNRICVQVAKDAVLADAPRACLTVKPE